jgi:hypothetical protein
LRESRAQKIARIVEAALVEPRSLPAIVEAFDVLGRKLPPGVPHALITRFWARRMTFPGVYYPIRAVPDEYVDAVLAGLRAWHSPASTFLLRAVLAEPAYLTHGWSGDEYAFARALVYDGSDGSVEALRAAAGADPENRTNLRSLASFAETRAMKEFLVGLDSRP